MEEFFLEIALIAVIMLLLLFEVYLFLRARKFTELLSCKMPNIMLLAGGLFLIFVAIPLVTEEFSALFLVKLVIYTAIIIMFCLLPSKVCEEGMLFNGLFTPWKKVKAGLIIIRRNRVDLSYAVNWYVHTVAIDARKIEYLQQLFTEHGVPIRVEDKTQNFSTMKK